MAPRPNSSLKSGQIIQDKQWMIDSLQDYLRRLDCHLPYQPYQFFSAALGQCGTSPQFLYVPLESVRLEEVPPRLIASQCLPRRGWLCEVAAWDIFIGVGLGSSHANARDRAVMEALALLSSGRLLHLLSMVRRWGSTYYNVIGLGTHLHGQNIHLPPFYTAPVVVAGGQYSAYGASQKIRSGANPEVLYFGPAISQQKVNNLIIKVEGKKEDLKASIEVLKKSKECSVVLGVDLFADKVSHEVSELMITKAPKIIQNEDTKYIQTKSQITDLKKIDVETTANREHKDELPKAKILCSGVEIKRDTYRTNNESVKGMEYFVIELLEIVADYKEGVSVEWIELEYEKKHRKSPPAGWGQHLVDLGKLVLDSCGLAIFHLQEFKESTKSMSKITPKTHLPSKLHITQGVSIHSLSSSNGSQSPISSKSNNISKGIFTSKLSSMKKPQNKNKAISVDSIETLFYLPPVQYPSLDTWKICVTSVMHEEAAHNFSLFVQVLQEQNKSQLSQMNKDLNSWANFSTEHVRHVEAGKLAAGRLGKLWYRIRLSQAVVDKNSITGMLLDKGGTAMFPVEDLLELPARFAEFPPQAVSVKLAGLLGRLAPSVLAQSLGIVRELLHGKQFTARVENRSCMGREAGDEPVLSLSDPNLQDKEAGNINLAILKLLKFSSVQTIPQKRSILMSVKNPLLIQTLTWLMAPPPAIVPGIGVQFLVKVVSAYSPACFLVQDVSTRGELERLERDMEQFYRYGRENWDMTDSEVKFLALKSENDGFRRAAVDYVEDGKIEIRFLDYGGKKMLDRDCTCWPLDSRFMMLPCQALTGRLARVVGKLREGKWGEEGREWFERRVVGRQFTAVLMSMDTDEKGEVKKVELVLCDQDSLVECKTVQDQLVGMEFACYANIVK